jgi:succinylarginine dihydrolase
MPRSAHGKIHLLVEQLEGAYQPAAEDLVAEQLLQKMFDFDVKLGLRDRLDAYFVVDGGVAASNQRHLARKFHPVTHRNMPMNTLSPGVATSSLSIAGA